MRILAADLGCFERAARHVSFQRTASCRRNLVIQVVDGTTGAFLGKKGSFGSGDDQFKSPKQVACNAAGDTLYVADSGNNRLVTLQEDTGQITPVITERVGSSTNVAATCNAGEVSIGGGIEPVGGQVYVRLSRRSGTTGWTIGVRKDAGVQNSFTPYVICMKVPL